MKGGGRGARPASDGGGPSGGAGRPRLQGKRASSARGVNGRWSRGVSVFPGAAPPPSARPPATEPGRPSLPVPPAQPWASPDAGLRSSRPRRPSSSPPPARSRDRLGRDPSPFGFPSGGPPRPSRAAVIMELDADAGPSLAAPGPRHRPDPPSRPAARPSPPETAGPREWRTAPAVVPVFRARPREVHRRRATPAAVAAATIYTPRGPSAGLSAVAESRAEDVGAARGSRCPHWARAQETR